VVTEMLYVPALCWGDVAVILVDEFTLYPVAFNGPNITWEASVNPSQES